MKHTEEMIKQVADNISNFMYQYNLQATKELMELFDYIKGSKILGTYQSSKPLENANDYINMYDDNFYTYRTFDELIESEEDQTDGLTEIECRMEINHTIWRLPCGWYVQYV